MAYLDYWPWFRGIALIHVTNKFGIVQELRNIFTYIKSINIDFSLVWFVSSYVDL